jgi:anti-anti-sigma regulatory factor
VIGEKWSRDTSPCHPRALTTTAVLSRPQLNTTVCTVTGTLHMGTTSVLRDALVEAQRDDNAHLIIDLSTIISMDVNAASLYTLLQARYTHDISGGGLMAVVIDPNSRAIPELHIATLEATFDMHHNLTDALHACAVANSVHTADKGQSAIDSVAIV